MAGIVARYLRSGRPRRAMAIASLLAACTGDNAGPPKPVVSVAVTPLTAPLPVGTTLQLAATPEDGQGNPLSGRTITWSSSDSAVATVSQSGVASGVSLGSATLTAKVDNVAGTASVTVIPGAAVRLGFTSQPTSLVAGATLTGPVVVTAWDVGGNVATGFSGNVTVSIGTNPTGTTLLGTTTMAAVAGVATFADLQIDKSGSGYTLLAASGTLSATSSPLTISPAQAVKLVYTVQPSNTIAGSALVPVQVVAADQFGNVASSFADSVSVAIGTNPGSGTLTGTKRVLAVNGMASFGDLSIDRTGAGYTLITAAASLVPDTSTAFTIAPATPSATVSTVSGSPATLTSSGGSSSATITVTVHDAFGNPVPGVAVVLAATGAGNTLTQPSGPTSGAGVASGTLSSTVSELKIVSATAGQVALAQTDTVTVNPASGGALFFTTQPTATSSGSTITPAIVVTAKDQFGNVSTGFTAMVTLAISDNPSAGTLGGTPGRDAVAGVATFNDLQIDKAGAGYTLGATTTGMTAGKSAPFNITAGPVSASQSTVTASPTSITASNGSSAATIAVIVRDAFGNAIPSLAVTLAATGAGNSLTQPVDPTDAAGTVVGTLSSTVAEVKTISATAGGITLAQTGTVTVNPAAGGALTFTQQPTSVVAGAPISPAVVVTVKDALGNVSTGFTGVVTVALGDNPGGGTLGGTLTRTAAAGVATFGDLHIDNAAAGYTLTVGATGVSGATSAPFTVSPGPVSAALSSIVAAPPNLSASSGTSVATITVTARDAAGNPVPGDTVVLAASGAGNSLTQPTSVTGADGTASGSLTSTAAGIKLVTATVKGTPLVQQATVTVSPGPVSGTQSAITASPTSIEASNGALTASIGVTATDAFGNSIPAATVVLSSTGAGNSLTQPASTTDTNGVATGTLGSTTTGSKVVSATINGTPITQTVSVTVEPGEVSSSLSSITATPATIIASNGASLSTITVTARDNQGNLIPGAMVTLATTGSGNVLTQPAAPTDPNGMASGTISSTLAEQKIMTAMIAGTGVDHADTITVTPGSPSTLAYVVQPVSTTVGATLVPPVEVEVRDQFGNRVTSVVTNVTLALGSNPGSATLTGGGPVAAGSGVASFPALSIDKAGTGYTLSATATGITGTALSAPFNISVGIVSASQSTVTVQPATITAGGGAATITVTAKASNGAPIKGATVLLSATGTGNTITQPAATTNNTGVATGSIASNGAGTKTITAEANAVVITQQPTVTVTAGAISAAQSTLSAAPASIVAGSGSATITVTVKDAFGNPVSGAPVTLAATGSGNTLTQPTVPSDVTGVATGTLSSTTAETKTVSATAGGVALTQTTSVVVTAPGTSIVFVGAGDIADCGSTNDTQTAALINALPTATVYTLGDNAYPDGTIANYNNCYAPTWGAFKARTHPSAGNHEYNSSSVAAGYFAYFGAAAGPSGPAGQEGYYSYNLGAWHIIVLNSNIATNPGSSQEVWLKADLAAHQNLCTLAYWHHPLYSSIDGPAGNTGATDASVLPFWTDLYAAGAELVLNGHRHVYERLAPMKPDATPDAVTGIREIIAGTGGESGGDLTNIFPTSEVRNGRTFGVLKLTLSAGSYAWEFIPVAGSTFTDSGTGNCH